MIGEFVAFEPAPGHGGGPAKWLDEAGQMKARQGEWFHITDCNTDAAASSFANAIMTGRKVAFRPAGSFEGRSRDRHVMARFVGGA